jgi:DNA mismatch repair ATPase MutL
MSELSTPTSTTITLHGKMYYGHKLAAKDMAMFVREFLIAPRKSKCEHCKVTIIVEEVQDD